MIDEQHVTFSSNMLRLEAILAQPDGASYGTVICHPHPRYGGDMNNAVVCSAARALQHAGAATLRFNFRGVGRSDGQYASGVGEVDDAQAAVAFLRERTGVDRIALAGYSFGAIVALRAGYDHPRVDRLIAVAPPVAMFDLSFLTDCAKPKLFLVGDGDPYCDASTLERTVSALPGDTVMQCLPGADHFFMGLEHRIGEEVARFVTGL